jgi:hypothetical protein
MKYLSLLVLLFAGFAHAQESDGPRPGVLCRMVCLGQHEDGTNELYARGTGPDKNLKIGLPQVSSGADVALTPADGQIAFYKQPLVDGVPPPPVAALAAIPEGSKRVIVFFFPVSGKAPLLYETVVFDLSANAFPPGGCMVLNINSTDVRFIIGEHKLMLAPGKRTAVPRPAQRDKYNMCDVAFQFQMDQSWKTAYESTVRFPEGQQKVFITYTDARTKRPKAQSFNFNF